LQKFTFFVSRQDSSFRAPGQAKQKIANVAQGPWRFFCLPSAGQPYSDAGKKKGHFPFFEISLNNKGIIFNPFKFKRHLDSYS